MPGSIFPSINPAVTSGNQLATLLNDFRDIVVSGFSGTSRPTGLLAGGYWVDTTNEATPTFYWDVKLWTGTVDVLVYRVNLVSGTVSIGGASDLFQIEKVSADNAGPILKFLKERIANSGQTLASDVIGEIQFFAAANDDSNPIVAKIKTVAVENTTDTEQGAALVFEVTPENASAVAEIARFVNGRMGLGTNAPEAKLHVQHGASDTLSAALVRLSEDALGPVAVLEKRRAAGVLLNDELATLSIRGRSDLGVSQEAGRFSFIASEAFVGTDRGAGLAYLAYDSVASNFVLCFTVDQNLFEVSVPFSTYAKKYSQTDVIAGANYDDLDVQDGILLVAGTGPTEIRGFVETSKARVFVVHNKSDDTLTIVHDSVAAAANDKIILPNGVDVRIDPDQSIEFFYDETAAAWKLKSGSGLGGGGGILVVADVAARDAIIAEERFEGMLVYVTANQTNYQLVGGILNANWQILGAEVVSVQAALTNAGTATINLTAPKQTIVASGSGGAIALAAAAFGATAPVNGSEITLIGGSDTDYVTINSGTGAKNVKLNGSFIELYLYQSITLKYISSLDLYIEISRSV